jgi:multiple sugar transport system substrate-binding protein
MAVLLAACTGTASGVNSPSATKRTSPTPGPVVIRWLVGVGKGTLPVEVETEKRLAAGFNANHKFTLQLEVVDGGEAETRLREEMAQGLGPDLVGPMDMRIASEMGNAWLNVSGLIHDQNIASAQFVAGSMAYFQDRKGKELSLPFAVDPSLIYYNKTLFDSAGLNYPPVAYGEKYQWKNQDGSTLELAWDVDTLRKLALALTIDSEGRHPADPGFRRDKIVQFGFASQLGDLREQLSLFGAGSFLGSDGVTAQIPDAWRAGVRWFADGLWGMPFIPNADYLGTELLNAGDPFNSGRVAMAQAYLGYACCLQEQISWDLAPLPAYQSKITAVSKGESFFIPAGTKHPAEAFAALQFLTGKEAASELLAVYEEMPALQELQSAFWKPLRTRYPAVRHWDVAMAGLANADIPSSLLALPNNGKAEEIIAAFQTKLLMTPGLAVDSALEELRAELQAVFAASPG